MPGKGGTTIPVGGGHLQRHDQDRYHAPAAEWEPQNCDLIADANAPVGSVNRGLLVIPFTVRN